MERLNLTVQTITVTIDGSDLHLISYYTSEDVRSGALKRPTMSTRPDIMTLEMPPHIFRLTNFRNPPKIEIGPDNKPRLVCDAEDHESVEVKIEEPKHHIVSAWAGNNVGQAPQVDGSFASSPPSNCSSPSISHSNLYSDGGGERWRGQYESSRISPLRHGRHEATWSSLQTNDNHTSTTRRGNDFAVGPGPQSQSDSWTSFQSPRASGHWQTDQYSTPTPSDGYSDRSRSRSSHSYQSSMENSEPPTPAYSPQGQIVGVTQGSHDARYDIRHQRPSSWMSASAADRVGRNQSFSTLSHQFPLAASTQGYDAHVPQMFSSGSWSSSSASSLGSPSSTGYSRPQLPSYDTIYVQANPAEEDYSDDYGKR